MKNKFLLTVIGLACLFISTTSFAEARHHHGCRSTSFGISFGQGAIAQPCYDSYVVQRYRPVVPVYRAPVYVEPACEERVVVVQPRPVVYQEQVVVVPRRPAYNYYSSFGFGWNWCR